MCEACKGNEECGDGPEKAEHVMFIMAPPIILERPRRLPTAWEVIGLAFVTGLVLSLPMCFPAIRLSVMAMIFVLLALIAWAGRKKKAKMYVISSLLFFAFTFTFFASTILALAMNLHNAVYRPVQQHTQEVQALQPTPPERHH